MRIARLTFNVCNKYDARQDFSSTEYNFDRATLTTMLGRYRLTDDPDGAAEEF